MRSSLLFATTMIVAIFLSSCNQKSVSLDFTSARGEVAQLANISFRFNKALVPDSLINIWDSTEYISFEPKISGRFRWESPDQLVFSPAQPLLPATNYTASIRNEVLRYSKYGNVKVEEPINFHTASLQLADAQVTWIAGDDGIKKAVPQVSFSFNYPVSPEELKEKLKLSIDGNNADYSIQSANAVSNVIVRLNSFRGEDKNYEAKVLIEKGMKPEGGNNGTEENIQTQVSIPSPYELIINNVESEHDGAEGTVRIGTSQQLTNENIASYINFEPKVPYTIEFNDNGITLHSEKFNPENAYALTIAKGLHGKIGGILKEDYRSSVAFGKMESEIKFTSSKAVYLSKKGGKNIEARITNTPKVKIIISKIYESNLLLAQQYGYTPKETSKKEESDYSNEEEEYPSAGSLAGDVIFSKEIDTKLLPKSGNGRLLNLSQFEDLLPDMKGVYHIMVRSAKDYWVSDSRIISLSDIGLIARQGEDKMFVFANSLKSAAAINGVTVNVYGANNQLIGTGATNADGVAELSVTKKPFAGFKPAMVIAKTADDFTYLPFNNTRVNMSRFDVGGKRKNGTGLDAFIYAERDIYRPGEKLNFAVMLRDVKWQSPGEIPLKIKLLLPNGKELKAFRKTLNDGGITDGSVDISVSAITGTYSMEVYSSNDILLATKNFMIEEFVPDRIKVSAKLDKTYLKPGEEANLSVHAINFFGPPAANRNYETELQVKQKQFSSKNFSEYDFSLANQKSFDDKEVREGKTDADGNAQINFKMSDLYNMVGLLKASFYTTVFDETGRPVSQVTSSDIYTQDVFNGIKDDGMNYYPLNQAVKFSLASVNKDGNGVNAETNVKVIKHEYKTILVKNGGFFRYESQKDDKIVVDNDMNVGSGTAYIYVLHSPGDYEIRVSRPGANAYVSKSFNSYGNWGNDNNAFEVNNEGNIDIQTDKPVYGTGETAKVLFKTPFSGRMLVTTEREGLLSYQYINVNNRTATMDLKISRDNVPNLYITATLFKPHDISDIPLTVAHGFQNINVEEKSRRIGVEIIAKNSTRSHTRQEVKIKALPNSYVTLAAVDNGVLQVSNFQTPDPYGYYYQKQALGVSSFDMYPLLFPELHAHLSSTGGDGSSDMSKRVNPMPAKRIKILSYWSGIKKTNGDGEAEFSFDIPQFSGQVRLMAVVLKGESFGSAESVVTVADPIVISTALPRFLSPGDTSLVPVILTNTTSRATEGKATLSVSGPLKVVGNSTQQVSINSNSESKVIFQVVAEPGINIGKVSFSLNLPGEKFTDNTDISVRPPASLQKLTGGGSIVAGSVEKLNISQNDFIPSSADYDLLISRSPVAEIADQMRYLVQYPFGCTEQTVSAAFPQLYYGDFSDLLNSKYDLKQTANNNITEAIRKIKMRQLYNGAVTLWDGEDKESWWTTIYAAHFLLEAKKAGFDVDNSLLETMLGYLSTRLKTKETIIYYYNRNLNKKIAPKEVSYSLYVLALANRSSLAALNYYKSNPQILALDSRYLISAAYAAAGDKHAFISFLPASFTGEYSVQQSGGSFYSEARDEAIALNSLIDVDPGNQQVPIMAKHVADRLKMSGYLNTQERSFSFLALGKIARMSAKSNATAVIKSGDKVIGQFNGQDWKGDKSLLKSGNIQIVTSGTGRLYYSWQLSGISATGSHKDEDSYIKIRRTFYDRYGRQITGNSFKQNDLIVVGLTLEKAYSNSIENIVITDMLPAGFEIENSRIKELPGMEWIKNSSTPTAMDVRDDRINFFVDAYSGRQTYYYSVRAVSTGIFKQGPVSADAMYNGEMHSINGAGTIKVLPQ